MTTTDIAVRRQASAIPAKLQYAHELAASGLLPSQYRRNPANVLWAVEYGEMLGLPPMAAMTGVHVIEGKPTASAGLISGLVRKAGHRLRVWGDNKSATCEITRSDDPEHPFSVTWTLRKEPGDNPSAELAGLLGKNTWKNYPASMLKSRAITQCARDACEEVLFGLHYTPEELGAEVDEDGAVIGRSIPSAEGDAYAAGYRAAEDTAQGIREAEVVLSPEQEWLAAALTAAPNHASLDACAVVWRKSGEMVKAGELAKDQAEELQRLLYNRMTELKAAAEPAETGTEEVAEGEIVDDGKPALDPEDPWAITIGDLIDAGEAQRLLDDARDQASRTELAPERLALIEQAVEELFPGLTVTEAQAA